jgi:copper resistance protein C
MSHCGQQWAGATFVTVAAAVLALMPPLGPVAASAPATGSTPPGVSAWDDSIGIGFTALSVAAGKEGLVAMHNELLGTDPPYGARLDVGPARIILTFDLPAQRGFSTLIVTGPDHNQWQAGPATEDATTVSAPLRPLGPAGEYTVAWRIVSADGHPVHGTYPFTLTTPGPGTAAAPLPNAGLPDSATTATGTGSAGPAVWPWLAGAGTLLLALAGVVMALRISRTKT